MSASGARRVVGVDIGGTGIKLGVVAVVRGAAPALIAELLLEGHADGDPAVGLDRLASAIRKLTETAPAAGPAGSPVLGVGVGCAGLVDAPRGVLRNSTHLPGWRDLPLAEELARRTALPVWLANDAACFLEAEWRHGAGRGATDALFVTIGTGIGGGLVLGGRPYRGRAGLGAELGHLSIDWQGSQCACGGRGCLELYVGRKAIEREAARRGLTADGVNTPADVAAAAAAGEPRAILLLQECGRALGMALAGLVNLLEPELIVVGGGVAGAGDLLLEPARLELVSRSMVARQSPVRLVRAAFGPRAGVVGAAILAARGGRP